MSLLVRSNWTVSGAAALWGASLLGILQVRFLPWDAAHSVCGPWGCGPPLPALVAYHGFWVVLFSLPIVLACRSFSAAVVGKLGWWLLGIGLAGLVVVGLWDVIPALPHWLPRMGNLPPRFYAQRYLLSLATLIDVPVVQIMLAGLCCQMTARKRISEATPAHYERGGPAILLQNQSDDRLHDIGTERNSQRLP